MNNTEWMLVPRVPTEEMLQAIDVDSHCKEHAFDLWQWYRDDAARIYRSMIAAAPTPPDKAVRMNTLTINQIRDCVQSVRKWYAEDIFTDKNAIGKIARLACDNILRECKELIAQQSGGCDE